MVAASAVCSYSYQVVIAKLSTITGFGQEKTSHKNSKKTEEKEEKRQHKSQQIGKTIEIEVKQISKTIKIEEKEERNKQLEAADC